LALLVDISTYPKTIRSDSRELRLDIPGDRRSKYQPKPIPKGKTTISGIDDKIISMYARGMSLRDISKKKWKKSISYWAEIISQISIDFEERLEGRVK
jgi:transposase-like protein